MEFINSIYLKGYTVGVSIFPIYCLVLGNNMYTSKYNGIAAYINQFSTNVDADTIHQLKSKWN